MKLSIVTTLYHSARHIDEFCERALRAAAAVGAAEDCEIVLVDDGSPDESRAIALGWHARDARIRVLDLSRHYGHYPAILAGLARARGDRVLLLDVDLEEPPELLQPFWDAMNADEAVDAVVGVQATRRGGWWQRVTGAAFYRVLGLGSPAGILPDSILARLMTRRFVDALVALPERPVSIDILMAVAGFRQRTVPVVKTSSSPTTYSLARRTGLASRAIVAHLAWLPALFAVPALTMILVGLALGLPAIARLISGEPPSGLRLIGASIWLVGGIVLAGLGVIAQYLVLLLDEARRRPTILRRDYTRE